MRRTEKLTIHTNSTKKMYFGPTIHYFYLFFIGGTWNRTMYLPITSNEDKSNKTAHINMFLMAKASLITLPLAISTDRRYLYPASSAEAIIKQP